MKKVSAAFFALAVLAPLFSGCAGFRGAMSFPEGFSAETLFSAPIEKTVREVRFAPDHGRFLVFMQDSDGWTEVAGEANGKYAWAGYSAEALDENDPGPFFKGGGVSFIIKDGAGMRLSHRGLLGASYDEIARIRHSATGVVYSARKKDGWYVVRAVPGEGGKLYEEPEGPFADKPVFAVNDLFTAVLAPGGVVELDGPTFSIPFPLSFMQENMGVTIGVPDVMTAASSEKFCALAAGSSAVVPGGVNAFAVTVKEDQGNQAGFSPFSDFDRILEAPVFSADASRVALVVEKEGKAHLVVADLKNPSFGMGPAFSGIKTPVFSPVGNDGACVAEEGGKFRLLRGQMAESGLFDFIERPVFSADGAHLAAIARRGGKWFVILDGSEHGPVSSGMLLNLAFSADGKTLEMNAVIGRNLYLARLHGG